jgi:alanyl-tRNA synthetase
MNFMSKTEELYYTSAYLKEFDAVVTACEKLEPTKEGELFAIILDKTAFFPEQGGQSSDLGTISGDGIKANISHVSIDKEGVIRHISDTEISVGEKVHGCIDWEHRFSNMQQHTGEHIFSGVVHSEFGYDNVGFHLSDSEVTMDYNGVLDKDDIKKIELVVNRAIWANVAVLCEFPEAERLAAMEYRSKKELTGDVRIVTIEGYDSCACCAPHVERTGEIGLLKVISLQNYKGGVRVNILCGKRALEYIGKEHEIVSELSGKLTTSADNVIASVMKNIDEAASLKAELSDCRLKLIEYELKEIDPALSSVFLVKEAGMDQNVIRRTVNLLAEQHPGFCGVFSGDKAKGYRFIIASGTDKKDASALAKVLREKFGAKGGGNAAMIQGSINTDSIDAVIEECSRT